YGPVEGRFRLILRGVLPDQRGFVVFLFILCVNCLFGQKQNSNNIVMSYSIVGFATALSNIRYYRMLVK
ncbi:MAG: hypothetical protein ACRD63_11760, partial [Pyrinomonadaceae bacterium]